MHEKYMRRALTLAQKARGLTSPNPMVGAVIVNNDHIVGQGYHHKAGAAHAEINALNEAGEAARGADLYVTLEPCSHYGRTPPCTEAIIKAGIKKVYMALRDPNPLVDGEGIKRLRDHGLEVEEGMLEHEARIVNEAFIKFIKKEEPFVALKTAMSLDGKIATRTGEAKWITGPEARNHGHLLRSEYDAILVGIGTVTADDPSLTCRLNGTQGRDPIRVIVDSKLAIGSKAKVLGLSSSAETIIATTAQASTHRIKEISQLAKVIVINEGPAVSLPMLMRELGKMGICSVLVEGGAKINGSMLKERIIDKFYLYTAPMLIGGQGAPGAFGGDGTESLKDVQHLSVVNTCFLGKDMLLTAYPEERRS